MDLSNFIIFPKGEVLKVTLDDTAFSALQLIIVGMGIIFLVLVLLCIILLVQGRRTVSGSVPISDVGQSTMAVAPSTAYAPMPVDKSGVAKGKANIEALDEETVAVIMAVVGMDTDIPLSELKIKNIKPIS